MGYLEIKRENDLEFQPIEFADKDLLIDLEWIALDHKNVEIKTNCYWCRTPLKAGNACFNHKNEKSALYFE